MRISRPFASCLLLIDIAACSAEAIAAEPLPRVTREHAKTWRQIYGPHLSPDGRWLAYVAGPMGLGSGDVSVVLRSTRDATERRYQAGAANSGAGSLKLSSDGQWIAFLVAPH